MVGFVHLAPGRGEDLSPDTGEVTALYLLQEHWRRGGGRRLMAAATDALRRAGFTEAVLWVLASNERGRAFYEAEEWTPTVPSVRRTGVASCSTRSAFAVALTS